MIPFIVFNTSTGQILRKGTCQEEAFNIQAQEGENVLSDLCNDRTDYILEGAVVKRPEMDATIDRTTLVADGLDCVTITGIPEGATVSNGENSITVTGGTLEYVTDRQGEHILRLDCFPYLDKEVVINAL